MTTIWAALRPNRILSTVLVLALLIAAGFAARDLGPSSLPTPGATSSGWRLYVQFPDVLNLPDRAKVQVRGRNVGTLDSVRLTNTAAVAALTLDSDTALPRGTIAELRQDTLLGDVYVALTPPETGGTDATAMLADGDTLAPEQTRAPVQVEQLMTSLSNFLGSGSLSQLGNTFDRLNGAFPRDPRLTRKIVANLTDTVQAWSADTASLDTALTSLVALTDELNRQRTQLGTYLAPESMPRWRTIIETSDVIEVFAALAPAFPNATFLVPTLRGATDLMRSVIRPLLYFDRPAGSTRPDNLTNLRNLLRDTVIPYLKQGPKVNVVRIGQGPDLPEGDLTDQAVKTLRMLGAVR